MKNLKVVIAAGGDGTRMEEITKGDPKPFLCFRDKPLIGYQLEILKGLGLWDIFLSFNKKEHIKKFKQFIKDKKVPQDIKYSFGIHSAFDHPGKLFLNREVKNYIKHSDFLSSYGDLIFEEKLIIEMYNAYKKYKCFITNSSKPYKNDKIEFFIENNFVVDRKTVELGYTTWRYGGLFLIPKDYHQIWLDTFLPKKKSLIPNFFIKCLESKKRYILRTMGEYS